jgi:hypothetical protein
MAIVKHRVRGIDMNRYIAGIFKREQLFVKKWTDAESGNFDGCALPVGDKCKKQCQKNHWLG